MLLWDIHLGRVRPMMSELQNLIAELTQDRSLDDPARLPRRIEALDRLEAYLLDTQVQVGDAEHPDGAGLYDRAKAISARLEAVNRECYQAIRDEIQRGARPDRLLQWAPASARGAPASPRDGHTASRANGDGYDYLDVLISRVLQFEQCDTEVAGLAPEMVPYQPTPARHIFGLISRAALTERDVLVDLGSGLGHVSLLASICTGARGIGIEREAAYVDCARRSALGLNLINVTFIQQDARAADLSSGTVFYLYTPFTGTILRSVLDSLRREAESREIRISTYGPCTPIVAMEPWLEAVEPPQMNRPAIFRRAPASLQRFLSYNIDQRADHLTVGQPK